MVNTLELRGIDAYSPEIQTFVREIEQSFLQVLNNCVPADQQEKEAIQLRDTVEGIGNCLEMHCAPGEVFNCFSCGAFKEAYHASDSIVVKFCSTDNETKREQALLAAAKEANILELFVPTFFISSLLICLSLNSMIQILLDIPMTPTIIHGARTPILKPSS